MIERCGYLHTVTTLLTTGTVPGSNLVLEMGNKESSSNDGIFSSLDRPSVLEARDVRSVAKYIKSDKCKNIYVMVRSISPANVHNV